MIEDGKNMVFEDNKHLTLSEDDQNSTFRQPFLAFSFGVHQAFTRATVYPPSSVEAGAGKKQDGAIEGSRLGRSPSFWEVAKWRIICC